MTAFRGLTWDHPRGRVALEAAARAFSANGSDTLTWEAQPLEGFESHPIAELADEYDLIVLDHPHLGDALAADCLRPLHELFASDDLADWSEAFVGPSFASYVLHGTAWALPLDAATQVSARRPDLVAEAPTDWRGVVDLARDAPVAVSIAGPHAFLTWCSLMVGDGATPSDDDAPSGAGFCGRDAGASALERLRDLTALAPDTTHTLNPIGLLELMSTSDDVAYIPLVYGYSSYALPDNPRRVAFAHPPRGSHGTGSTIGGTGLVVTRRSEPSRELLDHVRWLVSDDAQRGFIPRHLGQPSRRSAWRDPDVDRASGRFYGDTLATIETSWVRPRFPGYVSFQAEASDIVRGAVLGGLRTDEALQAIDDRYRRLREQARGTGQ